MDTLLLDNDIYYVLAATDTMDDFLALLNISNERVFVLPTLKRVVMRHTKTYSAEQRERCDRYYTRFQETILNADEQVALNELAGINNLDSGEAQLLVRLLNNDNNTLATKDTRFVTAIKDIPNKLQHGIQGKIIILEHVLLYLYNEHGYEYMLSHFVPYCPFDKTISVLFSRGNQNSPKNFEDGLNSYIRSRINKCGDYLYPFNIKRAEAP